MAATAVAAAAAAKDRSRSPPFSLFDFQQLVTNAFDLHNDSSTHPRPSLTFRRAPTPVARSSTSLSAVYSSPDDTLSCSSHVPSLDPRAETSRPPRSHVRPSTSHSEVHFDNNGDRPRTHFNLIRAFKSRASAILRPSVPDPDASVLPIPATSTSRPSTARPSVSSQRTLQPLAANIPAPLSPLRSSDSVSPLATVTQHSNNLPRVRTRSLPKSFLKMSPNGVHPAPPLPSTPLDSFFDASALSGVRNFPPYARPSPRPQVQIHTQLPPLRKSRSFAPSIFTKKLKRSSSKLSDRSAIHRAKSSYGLSPTGQISDSVVDHLRCPSPFTNPRIPPPLPCSDGLDVPDYVFQRRGSATSSCTLSSTKSTSTLSDRVSSVFSVPISFISKSRSRSKLHLSIPSSTQSSPSSVSTAATSPPVTPLSPTFTFGGDTSVHSPTTKRTTSYHASVDPNLSRTSFHYFETEEEAVAIGRVLTPEPDPFAKPEIELEWERDYGRDATPRPMSAQSRRRSGMRRKRESAASRTGASIIIIEPRDDMSSCDSYVDISPTYSFPSSCSIHVGPESVEKIFSASVNATPPSPTKGNQQAHPPSAWSASSSPTKAGKEHQYKLLLDSADNAKALPRRPPSRPLPLIPSTEADVFDDAIPDAITSTPRNTRLRRERRSINSFLSTPDGSPSSTRTSLPPNSPSRSQFLTPLAGEMASPASSTNRSVSDRPPSPFPLVRELSEGSRNIKKDLSEVVNLIDSGVGLDLSDEDSFEAGQDDSCLLTKAFVESVESPKSRTSHRESLHTSSHRDISDFEDTIGNFQSHHTSRCDTPIPGTNALLTDEDEDEDTNTEDWDSETTRSTAFFSARSSITSAGSDEDGAEADDDVTTRTLLADYSFRFPGTPELELDYGTS